MTAVGSVAVTGQRPGVRRTARGILPNELESAFTGRVVPLVVACVASGGCCVGELRAWGRHLDRADRSRGWRARTLLILAPRPGRRSRPRPRLLKGFCAGAWGWSDHWVARESLAAARRRGGATAAHACRLGPVRVSRGAVRQSSGTIWCSALARDGRRRKSRVIAPRIALLQHASLNILQLANTRLSWRLVHGHEGSLRLERSMCSARPRSVCRGPRQGLQSSAPMRRRSKAEE
jgi:hypothetical protein